MQLNPRIKFKSKAIDFHPLQKSWVKVCAVHMNKSSLRTEKTQKWMHSKLPQKKAIQKTAEATSNFVRNEIVKKIKNHFKD